MSSKRKHILLGCEPYLLSFYSFLRQFCSKYDTRLAKGTSPKTSLEISLSCTHQLVFYTHQNFLVPSLSTYIYLIILIEKSKLRRRYPYHKQPVIYLNHTLACPQKQIVLNAHQHDIHSLASREKPFEKKRVVGLKV